MSNSHIGIYVRNLYYDTLWY